MSSPQEQLSELTHRTQENFKHLWEQWSQRSSELLKNVGSRSRAGGSGGNARPSGPGRDSTQTRRTGSRGQRIRNNGSSWREL